MSDLGGVRLSWVVLDDLGRLVDLRATEARPSPADLPPSTVKERSVIPARVPGAI
jgi:hypothetical protein